MAIISQGLEKGTFDGCIVDISGDVDSTVGPCKELEDALSEVEDLHATINGVVKQSFPSYASQCTVALTW